MSLRVRICCTLSADVGVPSQVWRESLLTCKDGGVKEPPRGLRCVSFISRIRSCFLHPRLVSAEHSVNALRNGDVGIACKQKIVCTQPHSVPITFLVYPLFRHVRATRGAETFLLASDGSEQKITSAPDPLMVNAATFTINKEVRFATLVCFLV